MWRGRLFGRWWRKLIRMDIRQEIAMQEQVLRFVVSLTQVTPPGTPGVDMLRFAGSLDPISAREMREGIESECERVDGEQW